MDKCLKVIILSLSVVILLYLVSRVIDKNGQSILSSPLEKFIDMPNSGIQQSGTQNMPNSGIQQSGTQNMPNSGIQQSGVPDIDKTVILPNESGNIGSNLKKEFGDSTSKIISTLTNEKDPRFQVDPIKRDEILREIKSELEFDPNKTDIDRSVIAEIYEKYFNTNVFKKLVEIDKESQQYIKAGNYQYIPESKKSDFDLQKYQELRASTSYGTNPITDKGLV
jgi:hypothetical protein